MNADQRFQSVFLQQDGDTLEEIRMLRWSSLSYDLSWLSPVDAKQEEKICFLFRALRLLLCSDDRPLASPSLTWKDRCHSIDGHVRSAIHRYGQKPMPKQVVYLLTAIHALVYDNRDLGSWSEREIDLDLKKYPQFARALKRVAILAEPIGTSTIIPFFSL